MAQPFWQNDPVTTETEPPQAQTPGAGLRLVVPPRPKEPAPQTSDQAALTAAQLEAARLENEKRRRELAATGENGIAIPGDASLTGDDYLRTVPPNLATQVKLLSEGRLALPTGMALAKPYWQKLLQMTAQYDPTFDVANAQTRVKTRKEFTSGMAARNITSFNTALGHLESLDRAGRALDNSSWQVINRARNWWREETGDPRITKFNTARQAVIDELERAFRGSSGTLEGIKGWERQINDAKSPEQLQASVGMMVDLLGSRITALGEQYDAGMGRSSDPINLLDTHAQQVMKRLGHGWGEPPAIGSPQGGGPESRLDEGAVFVGERGNGQAQIAHGPVRYATDQDRRFAAMIQAILEREGTVEEANALADRYGYPPMGGKPVYDAAAWVEAIRYNRTRPKGAPAATVEVPETGIREPSKVSEALGGADSKFGAFATGAGNASLAGFGDETYGVVQALIEGKPLDDAIAEANYRKGLIRAENPGSYVFGEIGGGVATQLGASAALARAAPRLVLPAGARALAPRALAGDAAYGAAYGAGESNDDRIGGVVAGGALGALGGATGRAIPRGAAGLVDPAIDPAVRALRDKGVRTTIGQSIGPRAAAAEEKLASIPFVGGLVTTARRRALSDFNRAVVDDALAPIGASLPEGVRGTKAMEFAQRAFDKAYTKARVRMRLKPDAQLVTELQQLEKKVLGGGLPEASASRLRTIYNAEVGRRLKAGRLMGDEYKKMMSALGRIQRSTRGSDFELSEAIGEMRNSLDAAARRSSPADAAAALDAADQGYALFVRAESAAAMAGGETATFTPSQLSRAVQRADGSMRSRAYLRGDALGQDMADAGRLVLGDKVPDSGTAARIGMGAATMGAAYVEPSTLTAAAGLATAYAPGIRDALASLFAGKRGRAAATVGRELRKRANIAGNVGVPLAVSYQDK